MAVVDSISIKNIRSHDEFSVKLSPTVNIITGLNGSGKTSILEAVYISLQGTSFKGSDNDVLQKNSPWWKIDVKLDDVNRSFTFNPDLKTSRKKITIDNKINYRLLPRYKYPVVLFEPEDLRLLNGSPSRRRSFIDHFISQLDPFYHQAINKYERALKQRNNLLKKEFVLNDDLFVWDVTLSEHGSYIIKKRIAFIEELNAGINEAYGQISKTKDIITIHYSNTYIGNIKQKLLNDLNHNLEKDKYLGYTTTGPHRHDVIFQFNNSPALDVASRGEIRSIILALKFLEVNIIEKITEQKPIILLDDVFSELDAKRQSYLIDKKDYQIIITSTHVSDINIKSEYLEIKI